MVNLFNIENWKLVTENELGEYKDRSATIYDPHYDNSFNYNTYVVRYNGIDYLCATDNSKSGIYPVVENKDGLELFNSFTVGKFDGSEAKIMDSLFATEERPQLL